MKIQLCFLLIMTLCSFAYTSVSSSLVVNTIYGRLKGRIRVSREGRNYFSFTRIPYAQPPLGELRFAAPKKPKPWSTIQSALGEPPACIQRNYLFTYNPPVEGKEDCLFINVYVPQIDDTECNKVNKKPKLLPVMVFIHWGGFFAGSSASGYFGPKFFMDKDIILVTFNYRLGPLGFLSTADDEAPGNYGFKDQVAALEWVRDNIEYFGGNKHNVTIFGQSAGGASVHLHLISPQSKGLFARAIAQSGYALTPWATPANSAQKELAFSIGTLVGCGNTTSDSQSLIKCLRNTSAEDILRVLDNFKTFNDDPLVLFQTVTENKTEKNPRPFLEKTPTEYIINDEIQKVPLVFGVVKDEGMFRAGSYIRNSTVREKFNANFEEISNEVIFGFYLSTLNPHSLYENATEFYLNGKQFLDITDAKNIQGFLDLWSDRAYLYAFYHTLKWHSKKGHLPIYAYTFEYKGTNSFRDVAALTKENIDFDWGTCHGDDLIYLFSSSRLFPELNNTRDILLSHKMIDIWTNFAIKGHPDPERNIVQDSLGWQPIAVNGSEPDFNDRLNFLNITGTSQTGFNFNITSGFYKERMKFWIDSDIFENEAWNSE